MTIVDVKHFSRLHDFLQVIRHSGAAQRNPESSPLIFVQLSPVSSLPRPAFAVWLFVKERCSPREQKSGSGAQAQASQLAGEVRAG
jgi:hypothetical protein